MEDMKCHHCEREAAFAVEKSGVKVGVCKAHLRERLRELADADELGDLKDELDVDRSG